MKQPWEIDVNVLIIFFVRDNVLKQTFEAVKKARPRRLLLWQDGPRKDRKDDLQGIARCREIVKDIDWDCEVYENFHDENMGCDPSTFLAQKWAFSLLDKCIILEDDMVADRSFFYYCKELLDKYENDERINHICGVNPFGVSETCPNDYFFAYSGTGAWASWKRVANGWDSIYSFLDKKYYLDNIKTKHNKAMFEESYKVAVQRRQTGKEYWETILGFDCMLNHRLVIIPKCNMISNIGLTENATHGSSPNLMSKRVKSLFYAKVYEQQFPMKHPEYIVPDQKYYKELNELKGVGHPILSFFRRLGYIFRCIFHGEIGRLFKALGRKIKRNKK